MIWHTTCVFAIDWIAPPVRSPVANLLADLSRAFAALDVPRYLFGAQAAILYGVARLTADVDVTARAPAGTPARGSRTSSSRARSPQTIDDVVMPVVEVSDLVILKVLAARPKDIDDLVTLLHIQRDAIDDAGVRQVLRMLEQALGQSDLLPAFDQARRRASS